MSSLYKIEPNADAIECGSCYFCQIDRDGNGHTGQVWDMTRDVVRWQFGTRRDPSGRNPGNPLNKPDFVFTDTHSDDELIVRRAGFFPSVFQLMDGRQILGQIRRHSFLQSRYSINIDGLSPWTFRLRLFTLRFWGGTSAGPSVWVVVGPSKRDWNILIKPGPHDRLYLAALVFMHTEWWNYG